jgi:hypothetical protein
MMESRGKRWVGRVGHRRRWKYNIKMGLRKFGQDYKDVD